MTLQNMTCLNFKAVEFPRPGSQWRQGEMKGRSLEEGSRVPCPCLLDGEAGTSPVENDVYPLNLPGSQAFARQALLSAEMSLWLGVDYVEVFISLCRNVIKNLLALSSVTVI